jgi:hypothetical protein
VQELDRLVRHRLPHHFVRALAHPAGGDNQVCVHALAPQQVLQFLGVVGGNPGAQDPQTSLLHGRFQERPVRVIDLAGGQFQARFHHLVPGRHQ